MEISGTLSRKNQVFFLYLPIKNKPQRPLSSNEEKILLAISAPTTLAVHRLLPVDTTRTAKRVPRRGGWHDSLLPHIHLHFTTDGPRRMGGSHMVLGGHLRLHDQPLSGGCIAHHLADNARHTLASAAQTQMDMGSTLLPAITMATRQLHLSGLRTLHLQGIRHRIQYPDHRLSGRGHLGCHQPRLLEKAQDREEKCQQGENGQQQREKSEY